MPLCAVLLGMCVLFQQSPAAPASPEVLQQELARLVDLPTAAGRERAAEELAQKNLASVAQWTEACRAFGKFEAMEAGPTRQKVLLQVLDQVEPTEVFLFVPQGYDAKTPHPLLLWGHGAGGSGADQYRLWQTVADRMGLLVLAPTEFGKEAGWGFTPRERAAQFAALRWARRKANVDENAVFVGGGSRGGHMTWEMMLRQPDLFAGAVPCIGGPRIQVGVQNNMRYLENVAHLPIRDLQGSKDDPLLLMNLHLAFTRLEKFGAKDARLTEFPDLGHEFDLGTTDWTEFFEKRRDPKPPSVVRLAAEPAEARSAWATITGFDAKVAVEFAPQVNPAAWDRLDDAGKRAYLLDRIVERTARLAVQDKGQGRFVASSKGVKSFALSLDATMLGKAGAVEVKWQSATVRKTAIASAAVLLRDFAERFDRTFLPIAQITVP